MTCLNSAKYISEYFHFNTNILSWFNCKFSRVAMRYTKEFKIQIKSLIYIYSISKPKTSIENFSYLKLDIRFMIYLLYLTWAIVRACFDQYAHFTSSLYLSSPAIIEENYSWAKSPKEQDVFIVFICWEF